MAQWTEEEEMLLTDNFTAGEQLLIMLQCYNNLDIAKRIAKRAGELCNRDFHVIEQSSELTYSKMVSEAVTEEQKAACVEYFQRFVAPGDWVIVVKGPLFEGEEEQLQACLEYALFLDVVDALDFAVGELTAQGQAKGKKGSPLLMLHQLQSVQFAKKRFDFVHIPISSRNR